MTWLWVSFLALAAVPVALFIGFYAHFSPRWRSTFQGKALMAQDIAMLLVLVHAIAGVVLDYPLERVVGIILFAILMILFWVMFIALRVAQIHASVGASSDANLKEE